MSGPRPAVGGPAARRGVAVLIAEQLRRPVPGGIGTYVTELARALARASATGEVPFEVRLRASRPPAGADPLAGLGLPVDTSVLPGALLVRAWAAGAGAGAGAGSRASVVQATSLAAPGGRDPLVVTVHDLAWRRFPDAFPARGRAWHEAALRRAARRAAAFVVPSAAVAAELVAAGAGIVEGRVHVIEHGADHLPPAGCATAVALLRRLGVTGPFLLAVGTLEPRKNLRRLLDAYQAVRGRLPEPWPLVVAGPSGWGPGLGDLPPGVVLAGQVGEGDLAGLYGRARLLAYVPLSEGFGLPVVEAQRAGLPVVSSDVPAAGGATLLVDPFDRQEIASGLLAVATDDRLRSRLAAAGGARAGGLTWEASAAAHLRVWEALADA